MQFQIIRDTREQLGWNFPFNDECVKIWSQKLDEGDYTVKELYDLEGIINEGILRIERKATTAEMAINLGKKKKQFIDELKRLQHYKFRYVICEFSIEKLLAFPKGSGIPEKRWYRKNAQGKKVKNIKMTGKYMLTLIKELEEEYDIEFIFAATGPQAESIAIEKCKEAYNAYL